MASERLSGKVRKDKKGRMLLKGEYQYSNGRYEYTYKDARGESRKIYSWCLTQKDKPPKGKMCDSCLRVMEESVNMDVKDGIDTAQRQTLDALFGAYIDGKTIKESTKVSYIWMYNCYISPVLGSRKVETIKSEDIEALYKGLVDNNGLGLGSLNIINAILHPIFDKEVMYDHIRKNPTTGIVSTVKHDKKLTQEKRTALEPWQQSALMEYMASSKVYRKWLPLFTTLLGTGLRIGEATGLRWEDVDFQKGIINVNHTLVYKMDSSDWHNALYIQDPKTKKGNRNIPMLGNVKETLLAEKERQEREGGCKTIIIGKDGNRYEGFVFVNTDGDVLSPVSVNRVIKRIVNSYNKKEQKRADMENREPLLLPYFTAHVLRHTFCSRLCEIESNVKLIQNIMGHERFDTTMNIYARISQEKEEELYGSLAAKYEAANL